MPYKPLPTPPIEDLSRYLYDELNRVDTDLKEDIGQLKFAVLFKLPPRPRVGDIYYLDASLTGVEGIHQATSSGWVSMGNVSGEWLSDGSTVFESGVSITLNSAGNYTATFTVVRANTNYVVSTGIVDVSNRAMRVANKSIAGFDIYTTDLSGSPVSAGFNLSIK